MLYTGFMETLIEVSDLTKRFGEFFAVDTISFRVNEGEIVGLLGPNGAGKTTTIFMLLDLITPTSGSIRIFGLEYKNNHEKILQQLNYSSTYVEMAPRLTVFENLRVMAKLYQIQNADSLIKRYAEKFEITGFLNKRHDDLSQGQKTRVYLCKSFLNNPKLLLLDEPGNFVDTTFENDFYEKLRDLNNRMAILMVSHDVGTISSQIKSFACVNRSLHYHPSHEITNEDLLAYGCPIQLVTHGDVPHTVLKSHNQWKI